MICANADKCPWLRRFGVRTCHRMFWADRCKPVDGVDDEAAEDTGGPGSIESPREETAETLREV